MVRLLSTLDFLRFSPRLYLVARTDDMSAKRVQHLECSQDRSTADSHVSIHMEKMLSPNYFLNLDFFFQYQIATISRSREVHQSWITTIISTLLSTLESIKIVFSYQPDLVCCQMGMYKNPIFNHSPVFKFTGFMQWPWNLCSSMSYCFPLKGRSV